MGFASDTSRAGLIALGITVMAAAMPARAQTAAELAAQIREMRAEMAAQQQEIARLREQLNTSGTLTDSRDTAQPPSLRVTAPPVAVPAVAAAPPSSLPSQPVGEAPAPARVEPRIEVVPQGAGVLTRAGGFVFTPSLEYTNSSSDRLVFRGIELVPGIQVGLIEASAASRNTLVATGTVRYGVTDTFELEASVPYLLRWDRVEVMQQREDSTTQVSSLRGRGRGDVEFGMRYQLNRPIGEKPIFVGSLRVKTHTGHSPYAMQFDEFGVSQDLATGSGLWAIQPGLSFLLPTDPAVIFGGIGYLYQVPKTLNRTIGNVVINRVMPGDAFSANIGFGFALNPRFSYSLAYRHNYLTASRSRIGNTVSKSTPLHAGAFSLGMSYRLTRRRSLDFGVDIGATEDAPDVNFAVRAPVSTR